MQTRVPSILGGRAAQNPSGVEGQLCEVSSGMLVMRARPVSLEVNLAWKADASGYATINLGATAANDDHFVIDADGYLIVNPDLLA